jgi:hypothetical protein
MYTYYHQDRKPEGLRRYIKNSDRGQKWDQEHRQWVDACCPRSSCEQTRDAILDENRAGYLFPGSVM